MERRYKRRSSRSGSQETSQENNIRELRPEDFNNRRADRDYALRPLYSGSQTEQESVQTPRTTRRVPTAKERDRSAKLRRKPVTHTRTVLAKMNLPMPDESNFTVLACILLLSFIGLVMVTSSGYYYGYTNMNDGFYFCKRQLMWLAIGLPALVLCRWIPLQWLRRFAHMIYWVSIGCSVLVLIIGQTRNGSTRWLGVGNISFQPAELAKIAIAIYMSVLVEEYQDSIDSWHTFFRLLVTVLIPAALVTVENLSSGAIVAAIGLIIMFVGGVPWKCFFTVVLPLVLLVVIFVVLPIYIPTSSLPDPFRTLMENYMYRTERIWAWLDPWAYAQDEGYQAIQSLYAVGSGGLFGRGLGNSIQKLGFIPEAHNDIIFSIICEELGLFGAGVVILLFGILIWHGIKISISAPNKFTCLMAAGLTGQIGIQAIMNIAVNTNSMPVTGVSLPFISYGGSSMLFLMASMGLLLNISRYSRSTSAE